ncbi:Gfo/Idh/MocA family protein [Phyllobacterium chamaecytisi]|uniref:Gfo/Idh/MocA family protein n=1 Tax=Phyllobacterium chamaecytisi TaxID=2876082 RepID=UPI001CCB5CF5|nr:Gfo/Idh/MocA family oxidoreductase [Phyllobacterium sp. KW56]MBZ9603139.1 Gfo/Idh/MocA family oxidoreductase [Phyllobacterium sp. KW56]
MNICMIGHGMMGEWHSESLKSTDARLHTVVGRRPEPTEAFARRFGYAAWSVDADSAIANPEIEIVVVAGPSETHASMAMTALRHGKHVLVEIPLALNRRDSESIVEEADKQGLKLGVVHPMRYRKEHIALLQRVRAGTEKVRHVQARLFMHRLQNVGATGYQRSWTDNILWHHGAHLVDVGLWLTHGGDLSSARRDELSVSTFQSPKDGTTGIPMEIAMLIETPKGQSIVCTGSYYSRERIFDVFVVTDQDSYRLDILRGLFVTGSGELRIDSEQENNAQVARDFVEAVRFDREPNVPGRSVLAAMEILQRAQDTSDAKIASTQKPEPLP